MGTEHLWIEVVVVHVMMGVRMMGMMMMTFNSDLVWPRRVTSGH